MNSWWTAAILTVMGLAVSNAVGAPSNSGLAAELGCAYCHNDLPRQSALRELAPDLSAAGLRYRPAYLFEFLRNPVKVRQHLGRARMPDFHLSETEALSLVAFLERQRTIPGSWPELPPGLSAGQEWGRSELSPERLAQVRTESLVCLACHTLKDNGGHRAVEWANVGFRLQADWVKRYLVDPSMFGVSPTTMPALFYRLSTDGKHFEEITDRPAERIRLLVDYLFSLNQKDAPVLEQKFTVAKATFPAASAELGEALFRSQNCAACHRHHAISPTIEDAGPDLRGELSRVNPGWLTNYLRHPTAIRPFGYRPGSGNRMPDFHLTDQETREFIDYLTVAAPTQPPFNSSYQPQKSSAFTRNKAKLLLVEKLACLGCHRLGNQGGQIGPDLTQARLRLQPWYVHAMITNPRALNPRTIMPQLPLTAENAQLITDFLLQQDLPWESSHYLSPVNTPLIPFQANTAPGPLARDTYRTLCAICHGSDGQGDGFNSPFLPRPPTAHANPIYMSTRPDDTLYDGIAGGGAILNKSAYMPPWGHTLRPDQIKGLVAYMRTLCRCQPPAWSSDNETHR